MEEIDRIFFLSALNGILSILVGLWYFFMPAVGLGATKAPYVTMGTVALVLGVMCIIAGMLAKRRLFNQSWIILALCGIMTLPIGLLAIWAGTLAYKHRDDY